MMNKVKLDKENFEKGLQRFQALRSVFSTQTNKLYRYLGMEALKAEVRDIRSHFRRFTACRSQMSSMRGTAICIR